MRVNNYVKLFVRSSVEEHAGDGTVRQVPASTTAVFTFGDSGKTALKAAQELRAELRRAIPDLPASAFQLSTFAPSSLRGVPVVGEPIRELKIVEAA